MGSIRSTVARVAQRLRRFANRRILEHMGGEGRPVFYDVETVNPGLAQVAENYDAIREELLAILPRTDAIPRYHEVDGNQQGISGETDGDWRVYMLHLKGGNAGIKNRASCPRTCEVLDRIPNALQAFFSIMSPRKHVPAHRGVSLGFLRYHMAFVVPEKDPPTMRVSDRYVTWKERECFVFDDTLEHEIENEADSVRVVLIIDFMRPLPLHLNLLNRAIDALDQFAMGKAEWQVVFDRVEVKA